MAKFAPVAPIQILEGLYAADPKTFGDYHLLLAHHTVEHKARFTDLFKRAADDGWQGTVIMDNSIVELGTSVNNTMIAEAVNAVAWGDIPVYPVLPDVMGQGVATRQIVEDNYSEWESGMPGKGFCVVCQGSDLADYMESLDFFTNEDKFPAIEMLSIPRVLVKTVGSRVKPALIAKQHENDYLIHFLGFSDNISDDLDAVSIIPDAGIDSAVPLRLRQLFTEHVDAGKRPSDWFETAQVDARMIDNLTIARKMFGSR